MKPKLSYTIWFTQRTGSTLLCQALESTGIAGRPGEWLAKQNLPEDYNQMTRTELQKQLWDIASTSNGVLAIKHSFYEPHFGLLMEVFKGFPNCPPGETNRATIWSNGFPNHHHIFMTRRNKVRLAVSWWKAIQSQEWHRVRGEKAKIVDLRDAYSFEAIRHLYLECSMREAGIQEFLSEGNISPLTIVYEDFTQCYEETIKRVLEFLGLDHRSINVPTPSLDRTADDISEEWTQRFRREIQEGWENRGW